MLTKIRKTSMLLLIISFTILTPTFWFDFVMTILYFLDTLDEFGLGLYKFGLYTMLGSFFILVISCITVIYIGKKELE